MSRVAISAPGDEPTNRVSRRLTRLQKRLLCWLDAEQRRTDQVFSISHQQLVQALPNAISATADGFWKLVAWWQSVAHRVDRRKMLGSLQRGGRRHRNLRKVMIKA